MHSNHLAWAPAKPPMDFPDPLESYSPILIPGFDEDEYVNRPTKEDEEVVDSEIEVGGAEAKKRVRGRSRGIPR